MPSMKINTYQMVSMTDTIGGYGVKSEDETRAGLDGHTLRKLGFRGETFQLITGSTHLDFAAMQQAVKDLYALQGTMVEVINGVGQSFKLVFVHKVICRAKKIGASTDGNTYLVSASWIMQRTG
ncbi:MAG: hypothetical protein KAR42_14895 [candidate division Zixibacteria bacterium]|nr:hypothetical protein [candidate division Zixibacteria bacterium]